MKKEDKALVIESLKQTIQNYSAFYLVDVTGLDSTATSDLRRKCFKSEVKMVVVKNTLLQKALDQLDTDYSPLYDSLKGTTALMLANVANAPAKPVQEKEGLSAPAHLIFKDDAPVRRKCFHVRSSPSLLLPAYRLSACPVRQVMRFRDSSSAPGLFFRFRGKSFTSRQIPRSRFRPGF